MFCPDIRDFYVRRRAGISMKVDYRGAWLLKRKVWTSLVTKCYYLPDQHQKSLKNYFLEHIS